MGRRGEGAGMGRPRPRSPSRVAWEQQGLGDVIHASEEGKDHIRKWLENPAPRRRSQCCNALK